MIKSRILIAYFVEFRGDMLLYKIFTKYCKVVALVGALFVAQPIGEADVEDKLITKTLLGQIIAEFSQQTGIDLRESGRVLTEEEIECFKSVIETKEEIAQEDDLKGVIEKRAMIQLILGNLTSSDISYLAGLV